MSKLELISDPLRAIMVEELLGISGYLSHYGNIIDFNFMKTCHLDDFIYWYHYYFQFYAMLKERQRESTERMDMMYEDLISTNNDYIPIMKSLHFNNS